MTATLPFLLTGFALTVATMALVTMPSEPVFPHESGSADDSAGECCSAVRNFEILTEWEILGQENAWFSLPIPEQTDRFQLSFEIELSSGDINGIFGLSEDPADQASELSVIVRTNTECYWEGWRDAGGYGAEAWLPQVSGGVYHVVLDVDPGNQSYTLTVVPEGGLPVVILANGRFRRDAASLRYFCMRADAPSAHVVRDLRITTDGGEYREAGHPLT